MEFFGNTFCVCVYVENEQRNLSKYSRVKTKINGSVFVKLRNTRAKTLKIRTNKDIDKE